MKWLSRITEALFVGFVGAILIAVFQEPIAQRLRSDRVEAWFEMGPWMARPKTNGIDPAAALTASGFSESSAENLIKEDEDPTFARVTLTNRTREVVHNLRIRFRWPVGPYAYYQTTDGIWTAQEDARDLTLPDLAPGERKTVYLWDAYGFSEYTLKGAESFSSVGPLRFTYSRPDFVGDPFRETWFDRFMDDWFWVIITTIGTLLILGTAVMVTVWSNYAKQLMKNDDFYLAERAKFEDDPKNFEPNFAEASK